MANEIQEAVLAVPFPVDRGIAKADEPGLGFAILQWMPGTSVDAPPYWSRARDKWLRALVDANDPIKAITNTWINKIVTVPWSVQAHDRSIDRHVKSARTIEASFRRNSGSMSSSPIKGFKEAMKMFWQDYLTQDNGAFAVIMGDGPPDGPIVGAPFGLLHLDSALCTRTKDPEFPVKYLNAGNGGDSTEYKIHYTRVIEMANMPSAQVNLNGVGRCAVSCCINPAQELLDIYKYSSEMFGSRPPRQILYAEEGATVSTIEQAILHWHMKLDNEQRSHFGGTLIAAPGKTGQKLVLKVLNLSQWPTDFDRKDITTINMSALAAAFGMDLRDVAYTLGAPSRTGDAEVQDRKGRGKGVGEALDTFTERFNEVCVNNDQFYIRFDYLDDEQDEQAANIRKAKSEARQRDMVGGLTTVRVERELMWESGEISQEKFDDMELADGRLPDGLDVLLLFQSADTDYKEWLDIGSGDPTNVNKNDPAKMIETIHAQQIIVSEYIHLQTKPERRRKARQALAALEKLRLMYEELQQIELQAEIAAEEMKMAQQGIKPPGGKTPSPAAKPGQSPTGKESSTPPSQPIRAGAMVNGQMTKALDEVEFVMDDYETRFRSLVDYGLQGEVTRDRFMELLSDMVFATLLALFLRGARKGEGALTQAEWAIIISESDPHFNAIRGLADDIYGEDRFVGGQMAAYSRISGWLNIASGFFFLGQTYRDDDPYLQWDYSIFKDHCRDCVRLDGQVHRASEWRAAGWVPRTWKLECHGIHCGCTFSPSDGPSAGGF